MEEAKLYIEAVYQCPVVVSVDGDWYVFRLDDNNPREPVIGIFPRKESGKSSGKSFYPRGPNNYYFSKKIWIQKTLYFKRTGHTKKVVSGHLVVATNASSTVLKLSSYQVKVPEVDLEHIFPLFSDTQYPIDRLDGWIHAQPRAHTHSIQGYVYVKKILEMMRTLSGVGGSTGLPVTKASVTGAIPTDPDATKLFHDLVALCGNQRILIDHILLAIDTIFLDRTDGSYISAESPAHWRVSDKEEKLIAAFKAVVDEGKDAKRDQPIKTFKSRFAKVFNLQATMSDAWHPLHEASLQEMVYMPSIGSKGSCVDARYYQPDSLGFVCFIYTKEGQDVGLVRHLAQGCEVTRAEDVEGILKPLMKNPGGDFHHMPVMIDGLIVGYVELAADRSTPTTTPTLHWTQYVRKTSFGDVINCSPNGGILYRRVTDAQGDARRLTIQQQSHRPLIWGKDIFLPSPDHFMSTMASSLPLIQHSSAVRSIFSCSQRKSAACGDASADVFYSFSLTHPETPRLRTATEKRLGVRDGQNVVVMIGTYHGMNVEDSLVVSEEAVVCGDFHTKTVDTHTLGCKPGQQITVPPEIQIGARIGYGQLLGYVVGKSPVLGGGDGSGDADEIIDTVTHQSTHPGEIIDIRHGRYQIQIVVETMCPLTVGDKLASRYGQKGVVSRLVPLMDMPYTADGTRPSLIINPHAFPTRMTLGQMIESILIDQHAVGEVEAFRTPTLDPAHHCMRIVYDPRTYQPYPEKMFVGIVYYHTLKHKVDRKVKARGRFGKRHKLTGQPVGSRKLNGGIRIGEMEMAVLKAQGADAVLNEFYDIGDGIDARYCHACARWDYGGLRFDEEDPLPVRDFCDVGEGGSGEGGEGGEGEGQCAYTQHRVPRATLQLWEEAMAAGIQMKM
jgi:DNA-directed RNA polymerase subunit B